MELVPQKRIVAFDWARGLVILLMILDHSSQAFNQGRLVTDSLLLYKEGMELDTVQFILRWVTHLCAPMFVFLAGTSLAFQFLRAKPGFLKDCFYRGLLLILLEVTLISYFWYPNGTLFQVLFAIGSGFLFVPLLTAISPVWLLALSSLVLLGSELATFQIGIGSSLLTSIFLTAGFHSALAIGYPFVPWFSIMILGWCFGMYFSKNGLIKSQYLLKISTLFSLIGFLLIRLLNSYGNMLLYRENHSIVQWLHVSKYPPSLSFILLEGALAGGLLVLFLKIQNLSQKSSKLLKCLEILGQASLFVYIGHILILEISARTLGLHKKGDLFEMSIAYCVCVFLFIPLAYFYRKLKKAYPTSILRLI